MPGQRWEPATPANIHGLVIVTSSQRRGSTTISTCRMAQDPYLMTFVDQLSAINKGRAYYSSADTVRQYVQMDYMKNRRRRRHLSGSPPAVCGYLRRQRAIPVPASE
jgi:uncharacterized protein with von Willebrand factor type A (vWA) domain